MKKDHKLNLSTSNKDGTSTNYTAIANILNSEETAKSYSVSIGAKEIALVKDHKLQYLVKNSDISGFRPGKAPVSVIWNKHKDGLTYEIIDELVNAAVNNIVEEEKIDVVTSPKIEKESFDLEKGIKFEVTLSILPEIKFPDFKKITIDKPTYKITDADVEDRVKKLLSMHKKNEATKKTHKAILGNIAIIDFEGKIDGVAFAGGAAQGHKIELGSKSFIDTFEDQIVGHKAGEEFVVKVTFPKEYQAKEFAGKAAEFAVTLHEILEARDLKNKEELIEILKIASVEELDKQIRAALEKECQTTQEMQMKNSLLDKLDKAFSIAIPQVMLDDELKNLSSVDNINKELKEDELAKLANRRVRLGILLAELAKKHAISIEKDDVNKAISEKVLSSPSPQYAQALIKYYTENKQAVEQLKGPILESKTVQLLFGEVKNNEKPITVKKLLKLED